MVRSMIIVLTFCLASACVLPDVTPFVAATGDVQIAVKEAGSTATEELKLLDEKTAEDFSTELAQFAASWVLRDKAMTAMVVYADSLAAIVNAGNNGAEAVGKVIDSVTSFATAIGHPLPVGEVAFGVASDAIKLVASVIAKAKALNDLDEALMELQPVVDKLAELLQQDLKAADAIVKSAYAVQEVEIEALKDYNIFAAKVDEYRAVLAALDTKTANQADLAKAADIAVLLQRGEELLARRDAELAAIKKRGKLSSLLLRKTNLAITVWASAHRQLGAAVRENKTVDMRSVFAIGLEVREILRRINEL